HPGERHSILIERAARGHGNFAESAVMIVAVEEARRTVAGDVNVGPAVIVEIGGDGTHSIGTGCLPALADKHHGGCSAWTSDTGLFGDISKGSISAVSIQDVRTA